MGAGLFEQLGQGFSKAKERLTGRAVLDASNIAEALESVEESLISADVAYPVVKQFLTSVKAKALGQEVSLKAGAGDQKKRLKPADHFIAICQEELESLLGDEASNFSFPNAALGVVMMVGLQGSGKTTSSGKLARFLLGKKRKPLLVAADIYRPAAIDQLEVLGKKIDVPVFTARGEKPEKIVQLALAHAKASGLDTVIIDTAGRLAIDQELMKELENLRDISQPQHILYVCDAMMGQDAVTTATGFAGHLDLTGVVMTKMDGDARGGAALSVKSILGKPLQFIGTGESVDKFELFRPEGMASRILGFGDIVGLVQDFEKVAKGDEEEKARKMLEGQFNFNDFYEQIQMIQKMGSLKDLMAKLPMGGGMLSQMGGSVDEGELGKIRAMIDSMTQEERLKPTVFNPSRVARVARGSGRTSRDVQGLIEKFSKMRKMMAMIGKKSGGLMGKIPGMGGLQQMAQMKKMAAGMAGGAGGGMGDLFGGGGASSAATRPKFDRDRAKKMKKKANAAKKKNRKK